MRRSIAFAAGFSLALGTASLAGAESEMLSGQVTDKTGSTLTIRSVGGGDVDVRTTEETTVRGPQGSLHFEDIDEGDRVRVMSMSGADAGERVASEIEVLSSTGMTGTTGTTGTTGGTVTHESGARDPEYGKDPRNLMPDENPLKGVPDRPENP
jgi:hypothetical protein